MSKVIAVDIDQTVVDIATPWYKYLLQHYTLISDPLAVDKLPYDLSSLFNTKVYDGLDGREFFEDAFLYDNLQPWEDAVEAIKKFNDCGYEVVFVSGVSKGGHVASKQRFIDKWFDYDAVLYTMDKEYVKSDIFIDDSVVNCNKIKLANPDTLVIKYRNDFFEQEILHKNVIIEYNWNDIVDLITGEKE